MKPMSRKALPRALETLRIDQIAVTFVSDVVASVA